MFLFMVSVVVSNFLLAQRCKGVFTCLSAESCETGFTLSRVLGCPHGVKAPPDRGKMSASASPDDINTHHPRRGEEEPWTTAAAAMHRNPV